MKKDEIDAVDLVRRIRDEQQALLKDATAEECRRFISERVRRLHERLGIEAPQEKIA